MNLKVCFGKGNNSKDSYSLIPSNTLLEIIQLLQKHSVHIVIWFVRSLPQHQRPPLYQMCVFYSQHSLHWPLNPQGSWKPPLTIVLSLVLSLRSLKHGKWRLEENWNKNSRQGDVRVRWLHERHLAVLLESQEVEKLRPWPAPYFSLQNLIRSCFSLVSSFLCPCWK